MFPIDVASVHDGVHTAVTELRRVSCAGAIIIG
ncbi:MAG: hypothetical protein J07HQW2_00178 [Haloquadratum walsbyi J07HQW2]|uniref:Uncharacterized protein n=1 Tax=Haloquadratum walsbyi J07HQW2 TaxID=1238425 RepID=U1MTX1_9EURY|nr:MAG: hypothetical protein J07HQW2_00178 [Haloquadratum walsbyi J07HQW2]